MSNSCAPRQDVCVIRGDPFAWTVGVATGFDEIVADPALYQAVMEFRASQDDVLPTLLTLTAPFETPTENFPAAGAIANLAATTAETQSLPPYDIVHFVEAQLIAGSVNQGRLMQGKVGVND